jgi:hypothetical protein
MNVSNIIQARSRKKDTDCLLGSWSFSHDGALIQKSGLGEFTIQNVTLPQCMSLGGAGDKAVNRNRQETHMPYTFWHGVIVPWPLIVMLA